MSTFYSFSEPLECSNRESLGINMNQYPLPNFWLTLNFDSESYEAGKDNLNEAYRLTRKIIGGFPTSAIAVDSFLLFPPLNPPAHLFAYSVRFMRAIKLSTTYTKGLFQASQYRLTYDSLNYKNSVVENWNCWIKSLDFLAFLRAKESLK